MKTQKLNLSFLSIKRDTTEAHDAIQLHQRRLGTKKCNHAESLLENACNEEMEMESALLSDDEHH